MFYTLNLSLDLWLTGPSLPCISGVLVLRYRNLIRFRFHILARKLPGGSVNFPLRHIRRLMAGRPSFCDERINWVERALGTAALSRDPAPLPNLPGSCDPEPQASRGRDEGAGSVTAAERGG